MSVISIKPGGRKINKSHINNPFDSYVGFKQILVTDSTLTALTRDQHHWFLSLQCSDFISRDNSIQEAEENSRVIGIPCV